MKDKIERIKLLAIKHQATLAYVAGTALGCYFTYHTMKQHTMPRNISMDLDCTAEQFKALIDEVNGQGVELVDEAANATITLFTQQPLEV